MSTATVGHLPVIGVVKVVSPIWPYWLGLCLAVAGVAYLVSENKDFLRHYYRMSKTSKKKRASLFTGVSLVLGLINSEVDINVGFLQALCGFVHLISRKGIIHFYIGLRPFVLLHRADTVEPLLTSGTNIVKSNEYWFLRLWLKEGLVTSTGGKWKARRKLLTPAFHFRILEDFLPIFNEQSKVLVNKLSDGAQKEFVDVVPLVTMCTLDMICETAMGIKLGAQKDAEHHYVKNLHTVCQGFTKRIVKPWLWSDFIYFLTPEGRLFRKSTQEMDAFTRQVIINRKKEILAAEKKTDNCDNNNKYGRRQAFLDLLLHHHLQDPSLTEDDIQEEVDSFMFAGHDTTAVGISWALYALGLYPEVQKRVIEEIDSVFDEDTERPVTTEDVRKMKYLECVLKETQRVFPSAPMIGREIQEDLKINDKYTIPKGTACLVFSYMLHRDPEVFPRPEEFDPDRFLPENCKGRHPYAYVPFSAGPRNCIGQKFAFLEEKVVLINILRRFELRSLDHRDKFLIVSELVLRTLNSIRIKIIPRKRND